MRLLSVREHPEWTDEAIRFFQNAWASEASAPVYDDCIRHCIGAEGALPQWYVLEEDGSLVAGAGLIPNDFISRMDLMPWLCALYVLPEWRGNGLGGNLVRELKEEARRLGYDRLFLCTDHTGYYERFGFEYLADGFHPWGESSRIYCAKT